MVQKTLLSIGECMVELIQTDAGTLRKGFAGDTFNMAYYAKLSLPRDWKVEYLTALGTDSLSSEMLDFMAANKIGTQHIARHPGLMPGLYMVHVKDGERNFSYWRSASAARRLAADPARLCHAMDNAGIVFLSGITAAIVDAANRPALLAELARAKHRGIQVVFDPNIRPRLWNNMDEARIVLTDMASQATIVMPSFDDEAACFGDATPAATIERYRMLGVGHVVVKNGASGCIVFHEGQTIPIAAVPPARLVDTTSAGDSFNGTYLGRLIQGDSPAKAAHFAARVASHVIAHQGAIVSHDLCP